MFPLLPLHGRELADLFTAAARRIAAAGLLRPARDVGVALILLGAAAAGLWTIVELVPFAPPPRLA